MEKHLLEAAERGDAEAQFNLGIIYESMGKNELASYYYNKAIESNPTFPDAQRNVATLKSKTGLDVHNYPGGEWIN